MLQFSSVFQLVLILAQLSQAQLQPQQQLTLLDTSGCGVSKGCWFTPVGCEANDPTASTCNEIVKWYCNTVKIRIYNPRGCSKISLTKKVF